MKYALVQLATILLVCFIACGAANKCKSKNRSLKECRECCGQYTKDFIYKDDDGGTPLCRCSKDFKDLVLFGEEDTHEVCQVFKKFSRHCRDCCAYWNLPFWFGSSYAPSCHCGEQPPVAALDDACASETGSPEQCQQCCAGRSLESMWQPQDGEQPASCQCNGENGGTGESSPDECRVYTSQWYQCRDCCSNWSMNYDFDQNPPFCACEGELEEEEGSGISDFVGGLAAGALAGEVGGLFESGDDDEDDGGDED